MTLSAGDTLLNGQYRILHEIGRGGFGLVYHAVDTLILSDVAITELIPALVADEVTHGCPVGSLRRYRLVPRPR